MQGIQTLDLRAARKQLARIEQRLDCVESHQEFLRLVALKKEIRDRTVPQWVDGEIVTS